MAKMDVKGISVTVTSLNDMDFISLTDMLKAKDGDFFISDWLRNRNTVEFLGIWEQVHNPMFNYGEFAAIKSQAGLETLNAHFIQQGLNQAERLRLLNQTAIGQMTLLLADRGVQRLQGETKP